MWNGNALHLFDFPFLWVWNPGETLPFKGIILHFRGIHQGEVTGSVWVPHRSLFIGLSNQVSASVWVQIFPSVLINILYQTWLIDLLITFPYIPAPPSSTKHVKTRISTYMGCVWLWPLGEMEKHFTSSFFKLTSQKWLSSLWSGLHYGL